MASIETRLESLEAALNRLEEILDIFEKTCKSDRMYEIFRDSLIQQFEFTFDLFWKSLKDFLYERYGISAASPRSVARAVFAQGLVEKDDYSLIEAMVNDRNNTSHCYDQAMAEEIARHIPPYYLFMMAAIDRIFEEELR